MACAGPLDRDWPNRLTDMQLARFRSLVADLAADAGLATSVTSIEVFRLQRGEWLNSQDSPVSSPQQRSELEFANRNGTFWRPQRSATAYFPLPDFSAVVAAVFKMSPKTSTQSCFAATLDRAVENSNNAWNATHDGLTGLLNKAAFDEALGEHLAQRAASLAAGGADAVQAAHVVSVISLDLDHFKQANDNYGHLYGDVLLQCFANRVQDIVLQTERRLQGRGSSSVGRTGGEEFSVVIGGAVTSEEIDELAEALRRSIADAPMPTEDEWQLLTSVDGRSSMKLPHPSERRTTVSVGLGESSGPIRAEDRHEIAVRLKTQADVALYRAKAGGRNTVRRFADIAARHGTILEHHSDTSIVVIDIGRQVGVRPGQEFIVFHPDFVGGKPFMFSDGRSKRRLGDYPRQRCGRVIAFDIQQEISFCRVVERETAGLFPVGSALELLPLGSIAHLLSSDSQRQFGDSLELTSFEALPEIIGGLVRRQVTPFVVAFGLTDVEAAVEKRGMAFVNQTLAALYSILRDAFPSRHALSQVQPTRFVVVLDGGKIEAIREQALGIANNVRQRSAGIASVKIGAFGGDAATEVSGDDSKLSYIHALDYALYALAAPESEVGQFSVFEPSMASAIVGASRAEQKYREALADYRKLRSLGVNNAYLENQAALAALTLRDESTLALEASERAIALAPENQIFRANRGYFQFFLESRLAAHATFQSLDKSFEPGDVYQAPIALAMYAQFQQDEASVDRAELERLLNAALSDEKSGVSRIMRPEVARALSELVWRSADA